MSFLSKEVPVLYGPKCKWHIEDCGEDGCKPVQANLCYNGDFYYSSVTIPITYSPFDTLMKVFNYKPTTLQTTAVGKTENEAVLNLIEKLNMENIAA